MVCAVFGLYTISCVGVGVWRSGLALSIGYNWVGFTLRWRQNPVSKHCVLNWKRTVVNVQEHNICINVPLSRTFKSHLPNSRLGQDTQYPDGVYLWFSTLPPTKCWESKLKHAKVTSSNIFCISLTRWFSYTIQHWITSSPLLKISIHSIPI
jgi:hypothetical protein